MRSKHGTGTDAKHAVGDVNVHDVTESKRVDEQLGVSQLKHCFSSVYRIRKTADFGAVFRLRKRVSNSTLIVYAIPNGRDVSRLGLSVSKRVGGAVVRNRWKRLIRESFRLNREAIPTGFDFVVIPIAAARVPSFATVSSSLRTLTRTIAKKITKQS